MLRLTLASIRLYRRRYTATALAIILGVAFCAATFAATAAAKRGLGDALAAQYSAADVVVRPNTGSVREATAAQVADLPEVSAVTVADNAWLPVQWADTPGDSYTSIGEIATAASLRWQRLAEGAFPKGADQVVLSEALAERHGVSVGDTVDVSIRSRPFSAEVVGLVESIKGGDAPEVFVADGVVDDWRRVGGTSELLVKAASGSSPDDVAAAVSAAGVAGQVLTTDEARTEATSSLTDDIDLLGLMFQAFAAIALFVAGLVIANTFTIVLAQRSRDLALMRCVGALRRQVLTTVLAEAVVLGLAASLAGVGVGLGLAAALVAVLNQTSVPVPMTLAVPGLAVLAIPFLLGAAITVLAAIGPARRATRVAPLAALRPDQPVTVRSAPGAVRVVAGLLFGAVGGAILVLAMQRSSLLLGVAGGGVSFFGVLVLGPVIVPAILRVVGWVQGMLPRRLNGGVPASLSIANSLRNPRRTAATTSALLIGVTLISVLTVGASSLSASATAAVDHNNPVDVVVSANDGISPEIVQRITDTDGVASAVTIEGKSVTIKGRDVVVASVSQDQVDDVVRDAALRGRLASSARAEVPWGSSDLISFRGADDVTLPGIDGDAISVRATTSTLPEGPILVPAEVLAKVKGTPVTGAMWLRIDPDQDARALMADLDAIATDDGGIGITGGYLERSTIDRALDIMLLIASALLGMAVVIALVGVGNTLSLSVIERSREQALLRALGMTRVQQRAMLASEAALMALVAAGLGVALGIGFGYAATVTAIGNVTEQSAVLDVPWQRLGLVVVGALVAGLLASLMPARRAAKITPASALSEA